MQAIFNLLTGGIAPLVIFLVAAVGGILTLFGVRRSGVKAGKAAAQKEAETHVEQSAEQAEQVRQSTDRLGADAARDELRKQWGRP